MDYRRIDKEKLVKQIEIAKNNRDESRELTLYSVLSSLEPSAPEVKDHFNAVVEDYQAKFRQTDNNCSGYCHQAKDGETFTCPCDCCRYGVPQGQPETTADHKAFREWKEKFDRDLAERNAKLFGQPDTKECKSLDGQETYKHTEKCRDAWLNLKSDCCTCDSEVIDYTVGLIRGRDLALDNAARLAREKKNPLPTSKWDETENDTCEEIAKAILALKSK